MSSGVVEANAKPDGSFNPLAMVDRVSFGMNSLMLSKKPSASKRSPFPPNAKPDGSFSPLAMVDRVSFGMNS